MVWYFALFLLAGSAFAADAPMAKPPVLLEAPLLTVDPNGNASAMIMLRNDTGADILPLRLHLSDFRQKGPDAKTYPLGTERILAAVNEGDKKILDGTEALKSNTTLIVRVTVTKLWEAGQSEAILKHGQMDIPLLDGSPQSRLKAIRMPAAYNVQIISPTPNTPEIHFVGSRILVGLKNSDPFTYRFTWKLHLNGHLLEDGESHFIDLPPGASKHVELVRPNTPLPPDFPKPRWLTAGTLKDEIVKGDLLLQPVFAGDDMPLPPPKDLPAMFRLSYSSDNWQQFWNIFWIFLLLAVGGMLSIWVHAGMPNTTRALKLRQRINDLETKIHGMGASIDSRWRVLLESHLPALRRELVSTFWIFPSFATTLDELTKKVDMIKQWVEVAYDASVVLHEADQSMSLIPHTVLLWLREKCAAALTPIQSGLTTDKELGDMIASLNAARDYLKITVTGTPNADLDTEITNRENRLNPELCRLAKEYPPCAGVVKQVQDAIKNPTRLAPVNYSDRDVRSLKVDLLWTFDQRRQQISDKDAQCRIENHKKELMQYLVADTHESLRMARLIVKQMCQDIYPEALQEAVKKAEPREVEITTDPVTVHAQAPVRLALRFKRKILNEAVARQALTCTWDFGDCTPPEDGWEVFHSYELPGKRHVQVTIYDLDGKPISDKAVDLDLTVGDDRQRSVSTGSGQDKPPPKWLEYFQHLLVRFWRWVKLAPETRLELIRLVIVLTLALLGLMASARQQAQNLSFLEAVGAVVAIGFGVDTIKNLVVQGSSR
jgi:hypothetical protein